MLNTLINERFHTLGITKNYKGYQQLSAAVALAVEDDFRLHSVIKEIYRPVAEKLNCSYYSVERNIRTISHKIWKRSHSALNEMAGYDLSSEPSASELISIITVDIEYHLLSLKVV